MVKKTLAPRNDSEGQNAQLLSGFMINPATFLMIAIAKRFVNFEAGGVNA